MREGPVNSDGVLGGLGVCEEGGGGQDDDQFVVLVFAYVIQMIRGCVLLASIVTYKQERP